MSSTDWRALLWWPADEGLLVRRRIQLWCWMLNADSYVLLKPAVQGGRSTRRAVLASTGLLGTRPNVERLVRPQEPYQFGDDVPKTVCSIAWAEGPNLVMARDQLIPNGLALRYCRFPDRRAVHRFLAEPLPDSIWDYTCEHPDHPGVRQPYVPCLFSDLPKPKPARQQPRFDFDEDT
jgi:hypothetical protein